MEQHHDWLAERFEENRAHLRAMAFRMLGSMTEAEDAVQEAWLRLGRSDTGDVGNLGGWLTTVVARVCLDLLRSRKSRREESLETHLNALANDRVSASDPETEALMVDSVGAALLVVLETLSPAERLAFVLHDMFAVPFDEIAPIVGRSPVAVRQLASRARRRVQHTDATPEVDRAGRRRVVEAFLAASREGDFEALLSLLDPDVMLRVDSAAVQMSVKNQAAGAPRLAPEIRGAPSVAGTFLGRANAARAALVDGVVGATWAPGGKPRAVFFMWIVGGKIVEINLVADPEHIGQLDVELL
ncbi:MAG TPA: sigma-70 family RNA polymerase sigma factor [Gemmatimonadaceae bacterium]